MKDVQPIGEAFSPQKENTSTPKHDISELFSIFVGHFCPPGSGSTDLIEFSDPIRIRNTAAS
jgi:hypothetical protein